VLEDLLRVFGELDDRARQDERLEIFRVEGLGDGILDQLPDGWHLSDCMARLVTKGGWLVDEMPNGRSVHWVDVANVGDHYTFFTPMLREKRPSAPLLHCLSADGIAMVFPNEVARSVAIERLGERSSIDLKQRLEVWDATQPVPVNVVYNTASSDVDEVVHDLKSVQYRPVSRETPRTKIGY